MARKRAYPGTVEAEAERSKKHIAENEEPEWIAGAPNYDAFPGWTPEEVMSWLNID